MLDHNPLTLEHIALMLEHDPLTIEHNLLNGD
jgi:hypothetical protein